MGFFSSIGHALGKIVKPIIKPIQHLGHSVGGAIDDATGGILHMQDFADLSNFNWHGSKDFKDKLLGVTLGPLKKPIVSHYEKQKEAQEKQKQAEIAKNQSIHKAMIENYAGLAMAEHDVITNSYHSALENQLEYLRAKGTVNAKAAASGMSGLSVDSMLDELARKKDYNIDSMIHQKEVQLYNIAQQADQIYGSHQAQKVGISEPSSHAAFMNTFGTVAQIAGTAAAFF